MSKEKIEIPVVEKEWYTELEYYLNFRCPHCNHRHNFFEYGINDGAKCNRKLKCRKCKKYFRLKVDECDV